MSEGKYVPPEYRRYIKPEDVPKLPKGLPIYRGERGGLYFDVREYKELTGKEPEIGIAYREYKVREDSKKANMKFLEMLREKLEEYTWSGVKIDEEGWVKYDKVEFKITKDERLVFRGDDKYVRVPERILNILADNVARGTAGIIIELAKDGVVRKYLEQSYGNDVSAYMKHIEEAKQVIRNKFVPEYKKVESKGKYSKRMGLVGTTTETFNWLMSKGIIDWGAIIVTKWWYAGNLDTSSIFAANMVEVFSGKFDESNLLHPVCKKIMETSKVSAEKFGAKYIYRGETDVETARQIIEQAWNTGRVRLGDYTLSSWTENEKLAKWYAAQHTAQKTAKGKYSRTYVMLRMPKDKYLDKVVMDWRIWGDALHPEMEVTLCLDDVEITDEDVFVYAELPGKKSRRWMSLYEYKRKGGDMSKLLAQMEEWE